MIRERFVVLQGVEAGGNGLKRPDKPHAGPVDQRLFFERLLKPITKKSQSMKILRQAVISRKAYQIFHQKALITFVLN
ncbi:hypothetical protein CRX51_01390 [Pluralibacter gergoviae]|nr:hypothetical protein CRX51_01390 [Pluralibacter gergoviae]